MSEPQRVAYVRGKIVAICLAILWEDMEAIPGACILTKLRYDLLPDGVTGWIERDEDFDAFVGICSETDHLPIGFERRNWSAEALAEKDPEVIEAERWAKEIAKPACKKLIERFAKPADDYSLPAFLFEG